MQLLQHYASQIKNLFRLAAGSPKREAVRTFSKLFKNLFKYYAKSDNLKSPDEFSNNMTSKNDVGDRNNHPKSHRLL